jgi:ethanolamine utilization protein EutM
MIETRGLVGAIEASDAMCKTAHVRLVRYERIEGALVAVAVRGPVADVESAVDAGAAAAARVGELVARHVIPAPEPQLENVALGAQGQGRP